MKDDYQNEKDREEEMKKQPKFKVVDRRRINADEIEASDEPPEPEPEAPVETEEEPAQDEPIEEKSDEEPEEQVQEEEIRDEKPDEAPQESVEDPLTYRNIVMSFLQTLVTVVWVHLGLVPHPQTQLVMKKLEEARKAIDLFEAIYKAVENDIPDQVKPEIARLLEDMKANYIDQL